MADEVRLYAVPLRGRDNVPLEGEHGPVDSSIIYVPASSKEQALGRALMVLGSYGGGEAVIEIDPYHVVSGTHVVTPSDAEGIPKCTLKLEISDKVSEQL